MKHSSVAALAAAFTLCLAPVASAADATSAQILAAFNAERVANGLPGGVTENTQWSLDCSLHNHYMAVNHVLEHVEDPTAPAYTSAGNFGGSNGVLSEGTTWLQADPWLNAPIHLNQMMSPLLQTAGFAESENFNCFTTFIGYNEYGTAPTDQLFSFPGNGGSAPYAQTAFEAPHTPGEWVGLPPGTQTGPYLIVYWQGPNGNSSPPQNPLSLLSAATVTGPSGPVQVDVLSTTTHSGDGYYLAQDSGFIVPVHPLQPNTNYQVTATFQTDPTSPEYLDPSFGDRSWTGSFSFHTTNQALTLLGPAGIQTTPGGSQPGGSQPGPTRLPAAASALRAASRVHLRKLKHGRLAVSVRLATAPARAQAVLLIGRKLYGLSSVVTERHARRVTLTLTLNVSGLQRRARGRGAHAALRVTVVPRTGKAAAVILNRKLTILR